MVLAHGVLARFKAPFSEVVKALNDVKIASGVYLEIVETNPKVAIAVGEKYFFRSGNYSAVTSIALEDGDGTLIKVLATASRSSFWWPLDYGASRDYVYEVLDDLAQYLKITYEIVNEVHYLEKKNSSKLHFTQ